jgi:anaerobic magnesium-protoporphyrin IX monomethyl ester cyclase
MIIENEQEFEQQNNSLGFRKSQEFAGPAIPTISFEPKVNLTAPVKELPIVNTETLPALQRNILFIYPGMVTEAPMTLGMLGAVAKQEGWNAHALVNTFKKPLVVEDYVSEAKRLDAKLVGITMLTYNVLETYKIVTGLKEAGLTVIMGGPHPTDNPQECIDHGANIVVQGEGEYPIKQILRDFPNVQEGIIRGEVPQNLSELPLPDLDIYDKSVFTDDEGFVKGFHRIHTSRACPAYCTFCASSVLGHDWRPTTVDKVIEDIQRRVDQYGITSIGIADDCFPVDKGRALDFCKRVHEIKLRDPDQKLTIRLNSRVSLVDRELLKAFKDAGVYSIAFGLESFDELSLKKMGKNVTLQQNIEAPWMAHEAGLVVYGCLMIGFPWETPKSIQNQIKGMHEVWDAVSLFQVSGCLTPFPGTAIYRQFVKDYPSIKDWWLDPRRQNHGIQVYQNAINPYAVSNFYQRVYFDDSYIRGEDFFPYTNEYRRSVARFVHEVGKHNIPFMYPDRPFTQKLTHLAANASMLGEDLFPGMEKKVGGWLFDKFGHKGERTGIEKQRDARRGISKNLDSR